MNILASWIKWICLPCYFFMAYVFCCSYPEHINGGGYLFQTRGGHIYSCDQTGTWHWFSQTNTRFLLNLVYIFEIPYSWRIWCISLEWNSVGTRLGTCRPSFNFQFSMSADEIVPPNTLNLLHSEPVSHAFVAKKTVPIFYKNATQKLDWNLKRYRRKKWWWVFERFKIYINMHPR